jgi:hypothetical protein
MGVHEHERLLNITLRHKGVLGVLWWPTQCSGQNKEWIFTSLAFILLRILKYIRLTLKNCVNCSNININTSECDANDMNNLLC